MTAATRSLSTRLIAISMATCWLGSCAARPEYARTMVAKEDGTREAPIGHGEGSSATFGGKLWNDEAVIENDQWDAEETGGKDDEGTSEDKEFDRTARNPQVVQHYFNPEATTEGTFAVPRMRGGGPSRALRKKSSNTETETDDSNSTGEDLAKYVRGILNDVSILTEHVATILSKLEIALKNGPRTGCFDCASMLSAASDDFVKTEPLMSDFRERVREAAERLTDAPPRLILGLADVEETELPRGRDVASCAERLERRMIRLLALPEECMRLRNDSSRFDHAAAIRQSVSSVRRVNLNVLDVARTRANDWSNEGAVDHPTASRFYRTSSAFSPTKRYSADSRASSGSPLLTARRSSESSSDVGDDRESVSKIAEEIAAVGGLLRFLRSVPSSLSEILSLIDFGCVAETPDEPRDERENGPLTPPPYRLEEIVSTPSRPAAAHIANKMMVAVPPSPEDESESATSTRDRDDSDLSEESDEPARSRQRVVYEEPIGAPRTAAVTASNSMTFDGPWSSSWNIENAVRSRFPQGRYPHCFYVNTIRYEGPVNSYGVGAPIDPHARQHHQSPPFHFEPATMAHDDFAHNDIGHGRGGNVAVRSDNDHHRPPVHLRSYHLKLGLPHGLVALASYPVKSGDFLVLDLGKCSLVGKLDETTRYAEFQLVERPIVFLKTPGRKSKRIWQVPIVSFEDVVGENTLRKLRAECERRSFASSRRHRYVRATTKRAARCEP